MKNKIHYKGFLRTGDPNVFCSKALDYTGNNIKRYTIGKKHYHNGELRMCYSGLHSCTHLCFLDNYYDFICNHHGIGCCEVIPFGKIKKDYGMSKYGKICSSGLEVVRELSENEIVDKLISEIDCCHNLPNESVTAEAITSTHHMYIEKKESNITAISSNHLYDNKVLNNLADRLANVTNFYSTKFLRMGIYYICSAEQSFVWLVDMLMQKEIISNPKDIHFGIVYCSDDKYYRKYLYDNGDGCRSVKVLK